MYDVWKIITGLIIFVVLFTSPIWLNLFSTSSKIKPELVYPKDAKQCVEDKDYMNHYHMDILNEWRDKVVRNNKRYLVKNGVPITYNGERLEMSLSLACMKCHENKQQFCDQCHNYLDVKPYCWDCHVEPSRGGK
jgi:hypothetical protein